MAHGAGREPVAIATIGRPQGLKGLCRVHAIGETLTSIEFPADVQIGREGEQLRPARILELSPAAKGFVCRFEHVDDRTGAEQLRNLVVYLPLEELPALPEGEYYHFQLEGLHVVTTAGDQVGTVVRVHNYPTVDALEIRGTGGTMLVPIREETVEQIDCDAGVVRVFAEALEELL